MKMTYTKPLFSKIAFFNRLKSSGTSAALNLAMLVLLVAATTVATAQTYTDIYDMGSNSGEPNDPYSGFIAQGRDSNMYSTSRQIDTGGPGDVFKITPAGILSVIYNFSDADGLVYPAGGLTLAINGTLYGATGGNNSTDFGTIFKITAEGTLTTLYSFTDGADGSVPAAPIQGIDGNFYGTPSSCTAWSSATLCQEGNANKYGAVYKLTPAGVFSTLHTFNGRDGANPTAPLLQATNGNLYGTTVQGGVNGDGVIFIITPSGNFKVLFNFGSETGVALYAPLIQGSDGNFYGLTVKGGPSGGGTAFKITPGGKLTVLHDFTGGSDGSNQVVGLVQATDGNFYGTNNVGGNGGEGTIFRVSSTGIFATLYNFDDYSLGANPQTTLLQHTNGLLYGDTALGGAYGGGTFYSFDVGLGPFVSFLPAAAAVGKPVEILGQGFTGTTAVSFNGTAAAYTVVRDTYLTATVPSGATSGFVTVTTPGGTLTSNKEFQIRP
jgi:uncharacterized repeat protein (TIGR03803 family)